MTNEVTHEAKTRARPSRRDAAPAEFRALPETALPAGYFDGEIIVAPAPAAPRRGVLGNIY